MTAKLWEEAGGDAERYRQLMRERGLIVPNDCRCGCHQNPPTAGHLGPCTCQRLPCGKPYGRTP